MYFTPDLSAALPRRLHWLLLTAFVLQEAVQNINEYPCTFYFSVNIPSSLADSDSLLRMVEAARQQLRQPEGVARLVLEYAETIDFRHQSRSAAHVAQLQRAGVRVMLDDCFSQGSVIFPARRLHFNAYKLDMSIVNDAQHDPKALALIKARLLLPVERQPLCGGRCGFTGEIYAVKIAGD